MRFQRRYACAVKRPWRTVLGAVTSRRRTLSMRHNAAKQCEGPGPIAACHHSRRGQRASAKQPLPVTEVVVDGATRKATLVSTYRVKRRIVLVGDQPIAFVVNEDG